MNTGSKIKQIRTDVVRINQYELAKRTGYLTQSQISKIEKGNRKVTDIDLKKIAEALGVQVDQLIKDMEVS